MENNNHKNTIVGIGASGLIGSRIKELLAPKYNFVNLSLESGFDITNPDSLDALGSYDSKTIILYLAAKADVDACEKDKLFGNDGDCWKINVLGTQNVVSVCKNRSMKLIYISTDFVFDGATTPDGGYTEENKPIPVNWYGKSKFEGEDIVRTSGIAYLILRLAYPYRKPFPQKKDFVWNIVSRLTNKQRIRLITDHIFTPTFVDDIASAIDRLIQIEATGIFHVVGSQFITPYDAAKTIARIFGFDESLIEKTTREEYFAGRAPRPFNLSMSNAKIEKLGVTMKTFEEGLQIVKSQI